MGDNGFSELAAGMNEARTAMKAATAAISEKDQRIDLLETALNRMVCVFENLRDDTEGRYPDLDSGCIECTQGATPDRYNTGLCAYHSARKLLGHS